MLDGTQHNWEEGNLDDSRRLVPDVPQSDTIILIGSAEWRKQRPLARGVLDYFPQALLEVAYCSFIGNKQHHDGSPLHWDKSKSTDEADAVLRHLLQRGTVDGDGVRHSAKVAWRALALLQRELDGEKDASS